MPPWANHRTKAVLSTRRWRESDIVHFCHRALTQAVQAAFLCAPVHALLRAVTCALRGEREWWTAPHWQQCFLRTLRSLRGVEGGAGRSRQAWAPLELLRSALLQV
jgi:hypothetical protein